MIYPYLDYLPSYDTTVYIAPSADIIGRVSIAKDSSIWFGVVIRGDVNEITIHERVSIQDGSIIHVTHYKCEDKSDGYSTTIESDCTIGHRVILHGCHISQGSLIGMGATILDGAIIGKESIVGAGSLVTKGKKFPPRSLIMGSPAKVVRSLTEDEIKELYASALRYVEFKNHYLQDNRHLHL